MLTAVEFRLRADSLPLGPKIGCQDRTKRRWAKLSPPWRILSSSPPTTPAPRTRSRFLNDTLPGILEVGAHTKMIVNRYDAIEWALHNAQKDDILVLAGKGA